MTDEVLKTEPARLGRRMVKAALVVGVLAIAAPVLAAEAGGKEASPTHRMMVLVLQVGVILFAARLGSILFEKLRLPGTLGELAAGMLIGPYALGQLRFYGFAEGLFPLQGALGVSPELYGLCTIASVVLLFMIGLETDLGLLLRYSLAGGLVGAGGVAACFLGGCWVGVAFGVSPSLFDPIGLLLGIAATATSVGITARILSQKRKLGSPEGVTILSAAVIDDVIGIILLAVVMGMVSAGRGKGPTDWGHVGIVAGKAVGVWLAATVLGLLASRRISFLLKWFGEQTAIAIMALGLALVLAGLFEEAGLAMIIGAYVMGLSLSRTDIAHVVRDRLRPVHDFLVPIFFCVMGMLIDLSVLGKPSVLAFGLAYGLVCLAGKVLGCGLPAMLADFNWRGALRIGVGMVPRGEVVLIIAGIGRQAGVFDHITFAAVVMMVMLNTLSGPPILAKLLASPARGTRKPVEAGGKARTSVSFELPTVEMTEFFAEKLKEVFESEGFFVHLLDRDSRLYQLRKDRTIIDLQCPATTLTFLCDAGDVPLVNTAIYEALAAVEQAVAAMRGKPIDSGGIATRLQPTASRPGGPSLAGYLTPDLVRCDLSGETKDEILRELVGLLAAKGRVRDVEQAVADIWQREKSMSTGLQYGVAIPHAKSDAVEGLVCAAGVKKEGVDYGSMDGEPSRIFILTLSPRSRPAPHVKFMSIVSQLLDDRRRQMILDCRTSEELYSVLSGGERDAGGRRAAAPEFVLSDYIRPNLMAPKLSGTTPAEIIDELLALMASAGEVADPAAAREAVLARERQMHTGLQGGVAIPHGRTGAVKELVCAVGLSATGVDFGAPDGAPARIIVLALTPPAGSDPYLQFLAAIIKALGEDNRQRVLSARTGRELYGALTGLSLPNPP